MTRALLSTDDLDMAQISQWLSDNQLPEGDTFLATGSVGATALAQPVYQPLTLSAGWANFGGAFAPAAIALDSLGFTHITGVIASATAWHDGQQIATVPFGFGPAAGQEPFAQFADDAAGNIIARVDVAFAGGVFLSAHAGTATGTSMTYLSLAGITYKALGV